MKYVSSINGYVLDNPNYIYERKRSNYKNDINMRSSVRETVRSRKSVKDYIAYIFIFSIISIVMFIGVLSIFEVKADTAGIKPEIVAQVVVQSGDSIWSIARSSYGNDVDIRKACYYIKEFNGLSDNVLTNGQTIMIPNVK